MEQAPQRSGVVVFGHFEVDLRSEELLRNGHAVRLPTQSFQVLRMLLSHPGELVARKELQKELWPAESFGDFEHGLNAAVNRLRDALNDSAENPKFIETLPRRGYRFIAPIGPRSQMELTPDPAAASAQLQDAASLQPSEASSNVLPSRRLWRPILFATVLALAGAGLLAIYLSKNLKKDPDPLVRVTPLTTLPGMEVSPAFSPDGSQVVFAWDGGDSIHPDRFDLYIKVVGAEKIERLTNKPASWIVPAWSPDGRTIAFARMTPAASGIFSIPARGGPERKLADASFVYKTSVALDWSPDSRSLLYASAGHIFLLATETGLPTILPSPPGCVAPYAPVFSLDGTRIALSCAADSDTVDIYTMLPDGSGSKYLCTLNTMPVPMTWSADGRRILLAVYGELLELNREGGRPRHLPFAQDAYQPAISRIGGRLVYVQNYDASYLLKVSTDPTRPHPTLVIAPSTKQQRAPDISPDGEKIVFESDRSGAHEVWAANVDGSDLIQLSSFHSLTGSPRWSPDGRQIVFDSRESGQSALYLVEPEKALPRRISIHDQPASVPTWSRDGKWIYFRAARATGGGIYRVRPEGGSATIVSRTPAWDVQEAEDGRLLYFVDKDTGGRVCVKDTFTGEEHPLRGMPEVEHPNEWVLTRLGIYFIARSPQTSSIDFFDLAAEKVTRIIPVGKKLITWGGLALSPDGKWIVASPLDAESSDLMLVEAFH